MSDITNKRGDNSATPRPTRPYRRPHIDLGDTRSESFGEWLYGHRLGILAEDRLFDHGGSVFAKEGESFLADEIGHAHVTAMLLYKGIQLLNDVYLFILLGKVLDELGGQRIGHTQLEVAYAVAQSFLSVEIRGAAGDHTDLSALCVLHGVEGAVLGVFRQSRLTLLHGHVTDDPSEY